MSDFSGVQINKLTGGLGITAQSADNVMGFVCGGIATVGLPLGKVVELNEIADLEALEVNAAYDANNSILVHYHISEIFRLAPKSKVFLMLAPQATTLSGMVDIGGDVHDLIISQLTNRSVRCVGVVRNPAVGYTPTLTNGLDADVLTAVLKAQALIDSLKTQNIFLDSIVIEGRELNGTTNLLKDLRTMSSNGVSVVVGADAGVQALAVQYAKTAAVGSALGMLAVRKVHENLGSVDILDKPDSSKGLNSYSLVDVAKGRFLNIGLSSGDIFSQITPSTKTILTEKGYIFIGNYEAFEGAFFNQGATCTDETDDFGSIEKNRVWNKAARAVLAALTPKINSTIELTEAGQIASSTVASWQEAVNYKLNAMMAAGEVNKASVYINPNVNVLAGEPIVVKLTIVPKGIASKITADIGFTNPFI